MINIEAPTITINGEALNMRLFEQMPTISIEDPIDLEGGVQLEDPPVWLPEGFTPIARVNVHVGCITQDDDEAPGLHMHAIGTTDDSTLVNASVWTPSRSFLAQRLRSCGVLLQAAKRCAAEGIPVRTGMDVLQEIDQRRRLDVDMSVYRNRFNGFGGGKTPNAEFNLQELIQELTDFSAHDKADLDIFHDFHDYVSSLPQVWIR